MPITYPPSSGYSLVKAPIGALDPLKAGYSALAINRSPGLASNNRFQTFTMEFYIFLRDAEGEILTSQTIGSPSSRGIYVRRIPDGLRIYVDDEWLDTGTMTKEQWHHVAIVHAYYDHLSVYLNGVLSSSSPVSALYTDENNFLSADSLGYYDRADVDLANIRVWDVARTDAQVAVDKDTDYGLEEPGLLWAISLDTDASTMDAEVGNGVYAVLGNNVVVEASVPSDFSEPVESPPNDHTTSVLAEPEPESYPGQISGTVTVKGDPAAQRVLAFVRSTGKKVAETTSAADGSYTLTGLNPEVAHYVVALDKNLEYNGVIADNIVPEVPA
ncbi:LamG-like jellyroll fold domain-containing protein [Halomonas sp. CKK8]|uniref:LamG-like jellyroll fold domain-containing protein n=1 Tax=Halomonas sp. CKK8 TaxID=3036127 RepID=UPI002415732F|nr:LamG-like jellyroll fold domain-containing protein [Halomonas sp. CKK8]WFM72968.1 hypothetical protein P8934_08220 [Halomonas sp. CKK8]